MFYTNMLKNLNVGEDLKQLIFDLKVQGVRKVTVYTYLKIERFKPNLNIRVQYASGFIFTVC
jgi:hypothetical protein